MGRPTGAAWMKRPRGAPRMGRPRGAAPMSRRWELQATTHLVVPFSTRRAAAVGSSTKRIRATETEDTTVGLIGARVSMEFHRFFIFPIAVGNDI